MAEAGDGLRHAVFVDVKGVLAQRLDAAATLVEDRSIQAYLIRVLSQRVSAVLFADRTKLCAGRDGVPRLRQRVRVRRGHGIAIHGERRLRSSLYTSD